MISLDIHFKESLHQFCLNLTREKVKRLSNLLESILHDLNTATKSSAGDKHETARAMIHIEQENHAKQLLEAQKTLKLLSQIKTKAMSSGQTGALIQTNKGIFYIATGLGKVKFDESDVFVISPSSPIGQKFLNSKINDIIQFNAHQYEIEQIA
ncbi:MAG: hypothetical protein P8I82_07875 [Flavobacteriales bacterium]|nr:hypothetical protein [Flavobacteriales bacterium]